MSAEVTAVGEALIDIVIPFGHPESAAEHVGGSPTNVAIGLARLGHATQMVTHIGRDARGEMIAQLMSDNGVTLSPGSVGAERTSTGTAQIDADGVATYDFDVTWDIEPGIAIASGHLHTGSIGAIVDPGGAKVLDLVRTARAVSTVSYDPNSRPSLMGAVDEVRAKTEAFVAESDIVKASDQDWAWLYPGTDPRAVLQAWAALGPLVVALTRGPDDPLILVAGTVHSVPARRVDVVDTVGAGDSFMSGMISGLLDAGLLGDAAARERLRQASWADIRPAIERAVDAAAITCSREGSNPPTRAELAASADSDPGLRP